MILRCRNAVLRDRREEDIEDYVRWFCTPMDWQLWDAPWEALAAPTDPDQKRAQLVARLAQELPATRLGFEIEGSDGSHLGWTNRYKVKEPTDGIAIGICLPDVERGGRGIGTAAFALHAAYRFLHDPIEELFTETWSGNLRMIGLAVRVGFRECLRLPGAREVRGSRYDALRFVLQEESLWRRCPWLQDAEGL